MPDPLAIRALDATRLVAAARDGDAHAFDELMRRYRPRVHALALQLTGDAQEADDVAQEVFLRAFRGLASFRAAAEFSTWLHRIAVNLGCNARRSMRRRRADSLDDPRVANAVEHDASGDANREAELRETSRRLLRAIDSLKPALRETVVLVALEGLTHGQTAELLECPLGTVAWRLHHARGRLAEALRPRARGDEGSGLWQLAWLRR
jgi:RNA polymerase sigma-70 factor (ECF subfamily)